MKFHPITELFQLLEGQELEDLAIDIELNGQHEPCWTYQGTLIDGRNRARAHALAVERRANRIESTAAAERAAAKLLAKAQSEPVTSGVWNAQAALDAAALAAREAAESPPIPPLKAREWDGQGSLVAFVLSLNLYRRHLDASQRAMLGARAAAMLEEEARQKQLSGLKRGTAPPLASKKADGESTGRSREKAARLVKASPSSVERAQKVLKHGTPELAKAVDAGVVKVHEAARWAERPPEEQLRLIEEQGAAARQENRQADINDTFERWAKLVEKLRRQMAAFDRPLPRLVRWAEKGLDLLSGELVRVATGESE